MWFVEDYIQSSRLNVMEVYKFLVIIINIFKLKDSSDQIADVVLKVRCYYITKALNVDVFVSLFLSFQP